MSRPRFARTVVSIAFVSTVAIGLAACTDDKPDPPSPSTATTSAPAPAPSPTSSASPADFLQDALAKSIAGPVHAQATLAVGGRTVVIDTDNDRTRPVNTAAVLVSGAQRAEIRVLGADLYLKQAGLGKR